MVVDLYSSVLVEENDVGQAGEECTHAGRAVTIAMYHRYAILYASLVSLPSSCLYCTTDVG